jgi:hypothetical protein
MKCWGLLYRLERHSIAVFHARNPGSSWMNHWVFVGIPIATNYVMKLLGDTVGQVFWVDWSTEKKKEHSIFFKIWYGNSCSNLASVIASYETLESVINEYFLIVLTVRISVTSIWTSPCVPYVIPALTGIWQKLVTMQELHTFLTIPPPYFLLSSCLSGVSNTSLK